MSYGLGYDEELPAGYQDADIEAAEAAMDANGPGGYCPHGEYVQDLDASWEECRDCSEERFAERRGDLETDFAVSREQELDAADRRMREIVQDLHHWARVFGDHDLGPKMMQVFYALEHLLDWEEEDE